MLKTELFNIAYGEHSGCRLCLHAPPIRLRHIGAIDCAIHSLYTAVSDI